MATSSRDQRANIDALSDPFARRALFTAYHVRRYAVLYVCGLLGVVALAMFPTYAGGGNSGGSQAAANGQGIYGGTGSGSGGATTATGAAPGGAAAAAPGAPIGSGGSVTGGVSQGGTVSSGS